MKKNITPRIVLTLIAIIYTISIFSLSASAADVMIRTSSAEAKNGETVYIQLDMMQNPGFSLLKINLGFDSEVLSLANITASEYVTFSLHGTGSEGDPFALDISASDPNGFTASRFLTLEMRVADKAAAGMHYVTPTVTGVYLSDGTEITGEATGGAIVVSCPHAETVWVDDLEANCKTFGLRHRECTVCGEKFDINTVVTDGSHQYDDATIIREASCTSEGEKNAICTVCGESVNEVIPKKDHDLSGWTIVRNASCNSEGEEVRACLNCFETVEKRSIPLSDHSFGAWNITKESTYTETGMRDRTCEVCGFREEEEMPALSSEHNHSFDGTTEVLKEATCNTDGTQRVYCSFPICSEFTEQTIPAKGHTPGEETVTVEVTCKAPGESVIKCTVCGEELEKKTLTKLNHTYERWVLTKEPTCKEKGQSSCTCKVCGYTITRTEPVSGHTEGEWHVTKEPSCLEEGKKEVKCTVCDKVLKEETVPATGHKAAVWEVIKEATCTETGSKKGVCPDCNAQLDEEISTAFGHKYGEWKYISPEGDVPGKKTRECSACGNVDSVEVNNIVLKNDDTSVTIELVAESRDAVNFVSESVLEKTDNAFIDALKAKVEKAYKKAEVVKLYEFNLEGEYVGDIRVRIPLSEIPEGFVNLKVYRLDETDELLEISNEIIGQELTFLTDHFSKYVVCGVDLHMQNSDPGEQIDEKSDMFVVALVIFGVLLIAELIIGFILIKKRRMF